MLESAHFSDVVCRELGIDAPTIEMSDWNEMLDRIHNRPKTVTIGLVGKYVQLHDAYLSVAEALTHGGIENDVKVDIRWVDSENLLDQQRCSEELARCLLEDNPGRILRSEPLPEGRFRPFF